MPFRQAQALIGFCPTSVNGDKSNMLCRAHVALPGGQTLEMTLRAFSGERIDEARSRSPEHSGLAVGLQL